MLLDRGPLFAAVGAALLLMMTALWLAQDLRMAAHDADVAQAQAIMASGRLLEPPVGEGRPRSASAILRRGAALGLKYVARSRDGEIFDTAGDALGTTTDLFDFERLDGRVRAIFPVPEHGPPPAKHRAQPTKRRPPHPRGAVIIEFEPIASENLRAHVVRLVAICSLISALLIALAILLGRALRQRAALSERVDRDRQLATLGEMSAVLAHEIRNPLTALKGHAQLLVEQLEDSARSRTKAERVVAEAVRLELLTKNLLEFVKTGALDQKPTDPTQLVKDAIARVPGLDVRLTASDVRSVFDLDGPRLIEALVNILENAKQAAPSGTPIDVDIIVRGKRLVVTIRDRGAGIEAGDEESIFEPFQTSRIHGTGLGLVITRRIIEAHGGTVTATNHEQGGAVFTVSIGKGDR